MAPRGGRSASPVSVGAGVAVGRAVGRRGRRLASRLGVGAVAGYGSLEAADLERIAGATARYYVSLLAALVAAEFLGLAGVVGWSREVADAVPALVGGVALALAGVSVLDRPELTRSRGPRVGAVPSSSPGDWTDKSRTRRHNI